MSAPPVRLTLHPHPQRPVAFPCAVAVSLDREASGALTLRYVLHADADRLRIPAPCPPAPADGLWQHTCFEAFVAVAGEAAYREFNFSPSGQWAAYAFSAERERDPGAPPIPAPTLRIAHHADRLELEARLVPDSLPPAAAGAALRIGLSAVVEDANGGLSYWALHHPAPQPDFHHRGGFAFELAPARTSES